jgi:anti-sigma-K factor RskA
MSNLPALPADDVYEVWVERDGAFQPSSLFVPRRDRTAEAAVPEELDDADAVLVTREPRGGSRQPTSPPLLRADLD